MSFSASDFVELLTLTMCNGCEFEEICNKNLKTLSLCIRDEIAGYGIGYFDKIAEAQAAVDVVDAAKTWFMARLAEDAFDDETICSGPDDAARKFASILAKSISVKGYQNMLPDLGEWSPDMSLEDTEFRHDSPTGFTTMAMALATGIIDAIREEFPHECQGCGKCSTTHKKETA